MRGVEKGKDLTSYLRGKSYTRAVNKPSLSRGGYRIY